MVAKFGLDPAAGYDELYRWSVEHFLAFWEEFWHFAGVVHSRTYDRVLDKPTETIDHIPFKWFDGALLNYAENLLRRCADDDKVALYSFGQYWHFLTLTSTLDLDNCMCVHLGHRRRILFCQVHHF